MDSSKLFKHLPPDLLEGIETWGNPPIVDFNQIRFNGLKDRCETFILDRESYARNYENAASYPYGFSFCKTRQRPYDLAVCAVLIIANNHAPDGWAIGSDGDVSDWFAALETVKAALGPFYTMPLGIGISQGVL